MKLPFKCLLIFLYPMAGVFRPHNARDHRHAVKGQPCKILLNLLGCNTAGKEERPVGHPACSQHGIGIYNFAEIGRASCRERVEIWGGHESVEKGMTDGLDV